MAERKPLVLINGQLQELPVGDTVPGSGGGATYPAGGTTGQVLAKASDSDNDVEWKDDEVGSGGTSMTDAEVKTAYENNPDTNAFTNALLTKLNNIEAGATGDQTGSEIVSAIDTELGQTDWKTGGGGGGGIEEYTPIVGTHIGSGSSSTSLAGNITFSNAVTKDLIVAVAFGADEAPTGLTLNGSITGKHIHTIKRGTFDGISFYLFTNASGLTGTVTYACTVTGFTYRSLISAWEVQNAALPYQYQIANLDFDNPDAAFLSPTFAGGFAIQAYMVRDTPTVSSDLTEDVSVSALGGTPTFYAGAFSGSTDGTDLSSQLSSPDDRGLMVTMVIKPVTRTLPDAPKDGTKYVRQDGGWVAESTGGGSSPTPETPTTLNLGVGGGSNTAGESIKGNIFTMTETRYLTGVSMPITNNATYTYRFVVVEIDYSNPTVSQPVTAILYRSPSLQIFNTGDADFIEHFKVPIKLESGKTYGICGESLTEFWVRGKAVSGLDNVIDQQGFTYVGRVRENLSGPCVVGSDLRDHVNNTTMTMTYYSVSENALVADTYGGVIYGDQDVDFDVTDEMLSGNHQIDLWSGVTTITVPPSLTGTEPVTFTQLGAADISFVAGSGVTINSLNGNLKLAGQYGAAVLVPKGNDTFSLIGDLKA